MIRRGACVAAIACIWIVLLGWAADLGWNTPVSPRQRLELPASGFHVVMGAGVEDNQTLRVAAVGDDGSALQAMNVGHLSASDFSLLRYRFDGFPRTQELSLVFRRAGEDDVQAATVPWPGSDWASVDLRSVPGWSGEIVELGFAEYATPQIVPGSVAFKPFRFDKAELWSPSWRGGLAALSTSWFGYTPWALLSVSALGPQREVAQASPLLPFALVGGLLSLFAAALILRWPRARIGACAVVLLGALWALLDLVWLEDFRGKHELTESIYAGQPWSAREKLAPDQDIEQAAAQVRAYFAAQPAPRRLLVAADSKYVFLKLVYLLLPLDAAPLEGRVLPEALRDTYVLLFRDSQWRYDAARGALVDGAGKGMHGSNSNSRDPDVRVEPVFESGDTRLYALRDGRKP